MNYKLISFDMQGTLTDNTFSDEFWIQTLPILYSKSKNIPIVKAKKILKEKFEQYGIYDYRYYSINYWIKELNLKFNFKELIIKINSKPKIFIPMLNLVKELFNKIPIIIISTTTNEFINLELNKNSKYFNKIYSSLDNFNIAGKTPEVYLKIAKELNIKPSEILHIGDNIEMDIKNARKAGYNTFLFDKNKDHNILIKQIKEKIGIN